MYHIVFLLTPEFSLTNVATAIDTLRVANSLRDSPFYKWQVATDSSMEVPSSCGLTLKADITFSEVTEFDLLLVCGSFKPQEYVNESTQRKLRRLARYGKCIGSMEAGAYHLAHSGAFDGFTVTAHYANLPIYAKMFPNVNFVSNVFTFDERRASCAGGLTSLDLMLHIIKRDLGINHALRCANLLQAPWIRDEKEQQSGLLVMTDNTLPVQINSACRLMEHNIAVPLPITEIASKIGVSRRQLDRLFRVHFSSTASDVYQSMRLSRARKLLRSTNMELPTVSDACGFTSYASFSRAYRRMFGWSPTRERRRSSGDRNTSMRLMPAFDLHPDQTQYAPDKLL